MNEITDVYSNKILVTLTLVEQELKLINTFQTILFNLNFGAINRDDLPAYDVFYKCWQEVNNLYDFLKNKYAKKLSPEEREELDALINKYIITNSTTLEDLRRAKDLIIKIMSISNFDNVILAEKIKIGLENYLKGRGISVK